MGGIDPHQLQEMLTKAHKQAEDLQEKLKQIVVEASSGGGTVTIRMNGQKQVLGTRIAREAIESGDLEMLQDLITAAVNEAGRKVDTAVQSTAAGMLGGLRIPGF